MKKGLVPEVCSGTYFPRRGRPQRQYFVVLDGTVLAGPFKRKREAAERLKALFRRGVDRMLAQSAPSKHLHPEYRRTIESVLREQEKALTAAMGVAS